jgi:hypothetical protein
MLAGREAGTGGSRSAAMPQKVKPDKNDYDKLYLCKLAA